MQTKLTLRLDSSLIAEAKAIASKRKKSVSQMIADYITGFRKNKKASQRPVTPLVASMRGLLRGRALNPRKEWARHLEQKYR